jgi:hypothetical protein
MIILHNIRISAVKTCRWKNLLSKSLISKTMYFVSDVLFKKKILVVLSFLDLCQLDATIQLIQHIGISG